MKSQKSKEQPQRNKKRSGNSFLTFFCWITNIAIWGLITYITISLYFITKNQNTDKNAKICGYILLGIYPVYLILEFCSPTFRYLIHKRTNEGIKQKLGNLFRKEPHIEFHAECYHYETRHIYEKDKNGNLIHRTENVRVVTYRDNKIFNYYSSRDISGLLNLKCDKAQIKRKCYIKLELEEQIDFADSITIADYEREKERFQESNRHRDVHMSYTETRTVPGITHHNLIKFGEYDPCTVHYFWYVFFSIFTLGQLYKWHISSLCIYQNYTIRKIISTRNNLNTEECDFKYGAFDPQINLITLKINYEHEFFNYLNTSSNVDLPTEEELQNAKKYESKVPKYELYGENDGDIYKSGTIKEKQDFNCDDTLNIPILPGNNI